ncbi:gem-associated protein 4 isoform X2 [Antennarius striatus]|uniref:gem-associated protein 4 isoform X2 n=1 Tax=Antennarius striatus TaxID=241820 RepID=UPI0035B37F9F
MTLVMNKDWAILQGAFLQAEKLSLPSSLSTIQKADWSRVGHPVLSAIVEICGQDLGAGPSATTIKWIKNVVCVVWLKLLSRETGEDLDVAWKENHFFGLQNSLPEVNIVVLLELVKSLAAGRTFASFLLHLPKHQVATELQRLVQHIRSCPTTDDDVTLLLQVWWELWRGREKENVTGENNIQMLFAKQYACLSSSSSSLSTQAAKRLKLSPLELPSSSSNPDVLHILFHALEYIKDHVSKTDVCLQALSVSLDALYKTFLIDQVVVLPPEEKVHYLSEVVSIAEMNNEKVSPELVVEAYRDLCACHTPFHFQPSCLKPGEALKIITELAQFWQSNGLLKVCDNTLPSYSAFKLKQSVKRVLTALQKADVSETIKIHDEETRKNILRGLLESMAFPSVECTPEVNTKVAAVIIAQRLDDYQNFAALFVCEKSWAACDEYWMDCLEKNQSAFQECHTLIRLTSTLMSKLDGNNSNVSQCRKLMKIVSDIFSALSFEDKNRVLTATLRLSIRGFFGGSVPTALAEGFQQELNMAFNCIIQGGGGAAASQGNLNTAVSLVARVAFQNPEAALKSCCHSAIFNKGASAFIVKILQKLPGLRVQKEQIEETQCNEEEMEKFSIDERKDILTGSSLLCRSLQEIMKTKSLSTSEKEQFLKFVGLLMMPEMTVEGEDVKQSFLLPQEVVNIFVLPNLSTSGPTVSDLELSLQLLHTALSVDVPDMDNTPHWVLDCSPFPLLYVLSQLHNQTLRCWEQPPVSAIHMETRELLISLLTTLGQVLSKEVAAAPSSWSRALFWLYNKMETLDWTVRFHIKSVWGDHFKNEVPSSLLTVCDLPEQEWSGLDLPLYGQGTGLVAWMECCSISDSLQATMLRHLSVDQGRPDDVTMFSKGLLVALTQTLPSCSISQWSRLLGVLTELITSGRLQVPFSLEYVDYLPLLDLKKFSCELRMSVLLLRVFQLLCGSSCSQWLTTGGWEHVGRLYAHAVREMMTSLKAKLPLISTAASLCPTTQASGHLNPSSRSLTMPADSQTDKQEVRCPLKSNESQMEEKLKIIPSQEVLFVLSQLFCHVQHVQVMMPGGQCEPLFLSSLEILSHYEAIMAAFPDSSSPLESNNTRHFFSTITDNLENEEMKAVLQQKISQLVSSAT